MKKAGIIGGIGPASTLDYYTGIIEGCMAAKKDGHYPEIFVDSIDMTKMLGFLERRDPNGLTDMLLSSVVNLKNAGADFGAIASNTPHIVFGELKKRSPLPLVSIVESTCVYAKARGFENVLVLGTKFTMTNGLYTDAFRSYGIRSSVPGAADAETVHGVIFPKLEEGTVDSEDKIKLISLAEKLIREKGADAVVLGCTELPLMIKPGDLSVPALNTTQIHVEAIVRECVSNA